MRAGPRLLLLDNYDSFTWNLAHYLEQLGARVEVRLNDAVGLAWVERQHFDAIASGAKANAWVRANPRPIEAPEQIIEILERAY